MLTNTFCHVPGISIAFESKLWKEGILSWQDIQPEVLSGLTRTKRENLVRYIAASASHLETLHSSFFSDLLPANLCWRMFAEFRHATAYIDIETTGLSPHGDSITTAVLFDGKEIHTYVNGENLARLREDIKRYSLIVTYNGKCFDIPFIERNLKTSIHVTHIDLRYVLGSLGYSGGLKRCEKDLGINRKGVEDVDGSVAVLLWNDYRRHHHERALETLLAYNTFDATNLEPLMVKAYNMKVKNTPFFKKLALSSPPPPAVPFEIDDRTIRRLKAACICRW